MAVRGLKGQRPAARTPRSREGSDGVGGQPRERRQGLYRLVCGLLALALLGLLYQLLNGPTFRVERVDVKGNYLVPREEVVRVAGVLGESIFAVDRQQTAAAVAALGTLREVEVALALPNVVAVSVLEYEPLYVWQAADHSYLVDERGVVLAAAESPPPLPTVREVAGKPRRAGERVDPAPLQAAARLVGLWPASLGKRPGFEYGPEGLTLLGEGWRADFGDGADLEAKLRALLAVVDYAKAAGGELTYVDLRSVDRPYFK